MTRLPIYCSTCRQVEISFLGTLRYAPDCTFSSRKIKKLPTVGGGTPPPTPSPRSVATLPRARSLRSLAKIVPPQMFWLITPLGMIVMMVMLKYMMRATCMDGVMMIELKSI